MRLQGRKVQGRRVRRPWSDGARRRGLCVRNVRSAEGAPAHAAASAGYRGDDGEGVGFLDRRLFALRQVANVFVVEVQVDEGAQLPVGRVEMLQEVGVIRGERGERFGDGG